MMSENPLLIARIALVMAKEDRYAAWYGEMAQQVGLICDRLDSIPIDKLSQYDILILCGAGNAETHLMTIREWLSSGKGLICSGSHWGLSDLLGVSAVNFPLGWDQIRLEPFTAKVFGGIYCASTAARVTKYFDSGKAAICRRERTSFIAGHLGKTMAYLTQGRSVETDGEVDKKSEVMLDSEILRSENGAWLGLEADRSDEANRYFDTPHVDCLAQMLLSEVVHVGHECGVATLALGPWPYNYPMVTAIAIECTTNDPSDIYHVHAQLAYHRAQASIYTLPVSFGADIYRVIKGYKHEIGLLFVVDSADGWNPDRIKIQATGIQRLANIHKVTYARPMNGRWDGYVQPYEAFAAFGDATIISSKGGRQPGTTGFMFGTSKPFRPHHRNGHPIKILEFPYTILNPGVITPEAVVLPIVDSVKAVNGCLHATFELHAVKTAAGTAGLKRLLALAKQAGSEFMTNAEMSKFEEVRRGLEIKLNMPGQILLTSPVDYAGLTLLVASPEFELSGMISRAVPQKVTRYGIEWMAIQLNIPSHKVSALRLIETARIEIPGIIIEEIVKDSRIDTNFAA